MKWTGLIPLIVVMLGCEAATSDFVADAPYVVACEPELTRASDAGMITLDGGCTLPTVDGQPLVEPPSKEPLPLTGSTLALTRDARFAIAVNADVSTVHFVHLPFGNEPRNRSLDTTFALDGWPFNPVEDEHGRVHLLLRKTGELATVERATRSIRRVRVCANPRGLAAVFGNDLLHVACAEGVLVDVRATDGEILRTTRGPKDLRDVVVTKGRLFVTTFRAAELLEVVTDADGERRFQRAIAPEALRDSRFFDDVVPDLDFTQAVAWKATATPGFGVDTGGIMMIYQLARRTPLEATCATLYNAPIAKSAWATFDVPSSGPLRLTSVRQSSFAVGFDIGARPDAKLFALVGTGEARYSVHQHFPWYYGGGATTQIDDVCGKSAGSPLGVAVTPGGRVVILTDTPALVVSGGYAQQYRLDSLKMFGKSEHIRLPLPPLEKQPRSTGHRLFHQPQAARAACATCHPEGQDDGLVWSFSGVGPRRTQNIAGGISSTAPFHWDGSLADESALVHEVMGQRMLGPNLDAARTKAVFRWIDSVPANKAPATDEAAAARGKTLFESPATGCASCHNGTKLTDNRTVNVGTGGEFQVPPLMGLGTRTPFMHDGCAKTLKDRFTCGGSAHGTTSHLTPAEIDDLVAYLETL